MITNLLIKNDPNTDWDERARGLGGTLDLPLSSAAEENVMCHDDDRNRFIDLQNESIDLKVRPPDGRRLYTATCGIWTKYPSGRCTPLYNLRIYLKDIRNKIFSFMSLRMVSILFLTMQWVPAFQTACIVSMKMHSVKDQGSTDSNHSNQTNFL